jgi:hypothetical protein
MMRFKLRLLPLLCFAACGTFAPVLQGEDGNQVIIEISCSPSAVAGVLRKVDLYTHYYNRVQESAMHEPGIIWLQLQAEHLPRNSKSRLWQQLQQEPGVLAVSITP